MENDDVSNNPVENHDESDMWELSNCCNARMDGDICSDCKEHCQTHLDQFKEDSEKIKGSHKYIDNMIAEVKDGTMDIEEVMTDIFGEGGKEEVKEYYSNPADNCTAEPEDLMDIMDSQSQRKEMY